MVRRLFACLAIVVVCGALASAQSGKPADDAPAVKAAEGVDVEVHFVNGSLLRLLVHSDKLDVVTEYGNLSVPIKDVRSIEFGRRYPEGMEKKIVAAIDDLSKPDFRARDHASAALVEMGPYSYPLVLSASQKSKDLEAVQRAKAVLVQLEAKFPKKALKASVEDKLIAKSFTIVGRISTASLKASTELFGATTFDLAKMDKLRALAPGTETEGTVKVDAAKYANLGQWMETNFEGDGRTQFTITAKGTVDTWPQQPNPQYMTGPAGTRGGGGVRFPGVQNRGMQLMLSNSGGLYGRVGENGDPFLIGDRFSGTLAEGKLYLSISPSQWQCPSEGTYEVSISK